MADTNDLINRGEAILAVTERIRQLGLDDDYHVVSIRQAIRDLPSEQRTGRWTKKDVSSKGVEEWQSAQCSVCGKWHTSPYMYFFAHYNYCPWCGARMDGGT